MDEGVVSRIAKAKGKKTTLTNIVGQVNMEGSRLLRHSHAQRGPSYTYKKKALPKQKGRTQKPCDCTCLRTFLYLLIGIDLPRFFLSDLPFTAMPSRRCS